MNSCSEPVYVTCTDGLKSLYIKQLKNQIYGCFLGINQWGGTCPIVSLLYKLLLVGNFFLIPQSMLSQVSKGCLPVHSMWLFSQKCVFH